MSAKDNDQSLVCSRLIWFILVESRNGEPFKGTNASCVTLNTSSVIAQFREAVKSQYDQPNYLKDIPPAALDVFVNLAVFASRDQNGEPRMALKSSSSIGNLGASEEDALVVVVPKSESEHHQESLQDAGLSHLVNVFNHACRWEGYFFEIRGDIASSVFQVTDTIVLYRRQAVDKLYHRFDTLNWALVKGPPGCGKSTSTFAYALTLSSQSDKVASLWIRADRKQYLVIRGSVIEQYTLRGSQSWDTLVDLVNCHTNSFANIFVDHCRMSFHKKGDDGELLQGLRDNWMIRNPSHRRLYAITSDGCNDFRRYGFDYGDILYLEPWTRDEYCLVLGNESARKKLARSVDLSDITTSHEIETTVNLKFHYAGISARFSFDYTIDRIRIAIRASFQQVGSFDALIKGDIGTTSPDAVNILVYAENQSYRFTSRFIADKLIYSNRIFPDTFTEMLTRLGSNPNRGGVGVIFEMYTICLISRLGWDPILVVHREHAQ